MPYGDTFRLHSNPGSCFKIYLDFDGHSTEDASWLSYWGGTSVESPAFSLDPDPAFTAAELSVVQQIWQRVAEAYSPFNVDVTTEEPGLEGLRNTGGGDGAYGIRLVITDEEGKNNGGIAYIGSFDWSTDTPAYVYANRLADDAKFIADAAIHEVGHTLGLSHDGQVPSTEYYYGHGSGTTDWAPNMGAGYYATITQFSKGEYYNASQTEDDLAIITTQNGGVTWRADEAGNTPATATPLTGTLSGGVATVASWGVISGSDTRNDVDMFELKVGQGGSINVTISSWSQVWVSGQSSPLYDVSPYTSLDVQVTVYDASGHDVAVINDPDELDARINLTGLEGGTYYLAIDGVGAGDPFSATPTGYTEYGSIGQYMIQGTYSAGPVFTAADFNRQDWYWRTYPDVAAARMDAVMHYDTYGWSEGRNPEILFDTLYYLQRNPDVAQAGVNPYRHYLEFGWKERRDPSPLFDNSRYLEAYPDVAAAGMNPLLHYERNGYFEGRSIWPA
ncbi:MAG TPA: zinc-dependent metalloprotease family protein [Acetobacteraceae bacterium]|nr:zinc-dependent metalloprotease family protein [Acetobacteraceae bacterium]